MRPTTLCTALALILLTGCSTLTRLGGAVGGAVSGAVIGGVGGAAAGAAGGYLLAETVVPDPPKASADERPQTVWGLIGQLVDQAAWLAFVAGLLWLLTWIAPSPKELFKRIKSRWQGTK
jgi:hypothetical protein